MKIITSLLLFASITLRSQIPSYKAIVNKDAPEGYYMFDAFQFSSSLSHQMITDGNGNLVFYKYFALSNTFDFKRQSNGQITYFEAFHNCFIVMDSFYNITDTVKSIGYFTDVHELQILPNGNYLLMGVENTITDLSGYNIFHHLNTPGGISANVQSAVIQEIDKNKNVVFEWHSKNHLSFDSVDPFWLNDSSNVDWTHSNALELDLDSNILLSSRHLNEITKIDRHTGAVIWRFGGKYNQFTFTSDTLRFYGQHDIRRLKNGHITLFDNGNHTTAHGARALEYELDEEGMTAKLIWSYVYDSLMHSNAMGNVQRIQNKMTLVNYGAINTNSVCFNVVDSTGVELFNLSFANKLYSYRAFYYPSLPWKIHQPQISCYDSSGVKYLRAESGYNNYSWNNGDNQQIIPVTNTGNYYVYVPYGQGGYVLSQPVVVKDMNKFCDLTGLSEIKINGDIVLYPNPAQNIITVTFTQNNKHIDPIVYDITGKKMETPSILNTDNTSYRIDISGLETGLYFISVNNIKAKFVKE